MKKLHVVGGCNSYANWLLPLGYELTANPENAHLLLFTGGSDIGSHIYGHKQLECTWSNPRRDQEELEVFHQYVGKIPMWGTCRGHQLLSALSGAKMIQDLSHPYMHNIETYDGKIMTANSMHHQCVHIPDNLIANQDYYLLSWTNRLSPSYIYAEHEIEFPTDYKEVETAFWPKTNCLGTQAHPEAMSHNSVFVQWCQEQVKKWLK